MWFVILSIEILIWVIILLVWTIFTPLIFIAIVYFLFLIISWVVLVDPNTIKTKEVFRKYAGVLRPWFNLVIPFITSIKKQDLFRKNFPVEVDWVTQDNVTAYIGLNVIYYVEDNKDDSENWILYKSVYSIDDPRTMMRSTIDEQLRGMMVWFTHKEIFSKREELWNAIEERLREKLSTFWYKLDSIQVRDVKLDSTVMQAMNKVVETQKFKEAAFNEAEAKKIMQVKEAEAEKESKVLLWEGMAGQRMKIAEWFKESVDLIKQTDDSLNAEKVLAFLLDSSRIETLWNIWDNSNAKLIYLNEDLEWKVSKARNEKLVSGSEIM